MALAGCQGKTVDDKPGGSSPTVETESPSTAEAKLQEQLRSGAFQLGAAAESLEEALTKAKEAEGKSSGAVKEGLEEILDLIDGAGSAVAEFAVEPPSVEEVKSKLAEFEALRAKAIQAIGDAMHDLEDARGIAASLEEDNPSFVGKGLADLIGVAVEDLKGAIEALGGKVESDEGQ